MPLAFNTRDGRALDSAGVFRDAEGRWWSIQARSGRVTHPNITDDKSGKSGHISFVRLQKKPDWLTAQDHSNLKVALELNQLLYKGNVKTFRSQAEADDAFLHAHPGV